MAADQAILREYLVALGFKINDRQHKTFDTQVTKTDMRMGALSKTVVGAATSVVTFTTLFAKSMERLYYSSRYAGSSAANMKALEFGAQQIGLKAGDASSAVTNMAAAIRANPGLIGLLTGKFGIQVAGRKMDEVLIDLVKVLRTMPPYIGQQFAAMFGIDPETLFNLSLGLEKMDKAKELQKEMAKQMGVNLDEAAEMGVEYGNTWRTMTMHAGLFLDLVGIKLMPVMRDLAANTHNLMNDWAKIIQDTSKGGKDSFFTRLMEGLTGQANHEGVQLTEEAKQRIGAPRKSMPPIADSSTGNGLSVSKAMRLWQRFQMWRERKSGDYDYRNPTDMAAVDAVQSEIGPSDKAQSAIGQGRKARMRELEQKYGLPPGLLDFIWQRESGRGTAMLSDAGAKGHFGFMDATAKQYGLSDPNNFDASADAAARLLRDRLKARGGDLRTALADYNWGQGRVDRYGLGQAPKETRDYMDAGERAVHVNNDTNIHIYGAEKPHEAADAVYEAMETVNSETVRNFSPKVR